MAVKPSHTTVRIDRIVVEGSAGFDAATFEAGVREELERLLALDGVDANAVSRAHLDGGVIATGGVSDAAVGQRVARAAHAALRRTQ